MFSVSLALFASVALAMPSPRAENPPHTIHARAEPQEYLDAHNSVRAQHNAAPLVWDDALAQYAQDYANKCVWQHSGGPYGENLAAGSEPLTAAGAVKMWADEEKDYDPANPQYSHYTQVVWKSTTKLGCGVAKCDNILEGFTADYYVCSYDPAGNVIGQFPENVE
ncbi:PR-1-like protein [Cylindrobasidium torrendii FP15055 ss-10]|uniref:PR-1-like protein n=1 Tax=Cylindrobasidium torrendii FP15055 ss-10 TaxID=1314674 RepID=A0A0D7B7I6_9AGAR|nr:PR-1-like protein [Cylindrobasidium torrendii FP15055 ss-10]